MKLTARSDLDTPIDFVFNCLVDRADWEMLALERGIDFSHNEKTPPFGPGASWQLKFYFRGRLVTLLLVMKEIVPDKRMASSFETRQFQGGLVLSVIALSPRRTRINLDVDIEPRTITARLLLNTIRLTGRQAQVGVEARLRRIAGRIQDRYVLGSRG